MVASKDDVLMDDAAITVEASVNARNVIGGTARNRVETEIMRCRDGR